MLNLSKRHYVDSLIEYFWRKGFMTVSRKYGTYLPEPEKIGEFEIDVLARYNKNYAIGLTLTEEDIENPKIINKINYLATRQTKFSNKKVQLFVGVPDIHYKRILSLINNLSEDVRKNIKLIPIEERKIEALSHSRRNNRFNVKFS